LNYFPQLITSVILMISSLVVPSLETASFRPNLNNNLNNEIIRIEELD